MNNPYPEIPELSLLTKIRYKIKPIKIKIKYYQKTYTCYYCNQNKICKYAYDDYNTNGDCIVK